MAIAEERRSGPSDPKPWNLCRMPFWHASPSAAASAAANSAGSSTRSSLSGHVGRRAGHVAGHGGAHQGGGGGGGGGSVTSVARSLLPTRRRLTLDPANKLYLPYEPGKQVRSAIRIKNTTKSHVAFKFQTTEPKSCFMRPPGAVLSPGESIIATVFKFVEHPENDEKPQDQKCKVKFKIMSLKVKNPMEYASELFDEQKDEVAVEQILRVVFLDVQQASPQLEKLKLQLAEADVALEACKKPPEDAGPRIVGEGLVIDEWKERRERYLARLQVEGVDPV